VIDRLSNKLINKNGELIGSEKADKAKNLLGLMSEPTQLELKRALQYDDA
jgi:hypothetical protein